jgi:exopolysaccharide production protein ExoY
MATSGVDLIDRFAKPGSALSQAGAEARPAVRAASDWQAAIRRCADVAIAVIALVILAPLLITTALLVWRQDGGPAFFGHRRLGEGGKTFRCWKFRSMVVNSQERLAEYLAANPAAASEWALNHKLKNDPRITGLGRFLRKSSVDELPQLFNVLVGEMSIVGPRPIVEAELEKYGHYIADYYSVRPGITGLWQVCGRNDVSYRRRVAIDVTYVRERTLLLDCKILLMTIPAILTSKGTY